MCSGWSTCRGRTGGRSISLSPFWKKSISNSSLKGLTHSQRSPSTALLVGSSRNMFIGHKFDIRNAIVAGRNVIEIAFASPVPAERRSNPSMESSRWHWSRTVPTRARHSIRSGGIGGRNSRHPGSGVPCALKRIPAHGSGIRWSGSQASLPVPRGWHPGRCRGTGGTEGGAGDPHHRSRRGGHDAHGGRYRHGFRRLHPSRTHALVAQRLGEQPLYTAVLHCGMANVDAVPVVFGVRTVRLLQEPDEEGRSFIIEINGRKVFCKGADWIPADTFLPRVTG